MIVQCRIFYINLETCLEEMFSSNISMFNLIQFNNALQCAFNCQFTNITIKLQILNI